MRESNLRPRVEETNALNHLIYNKNKKYVSPTPKILRSIFKITDSSRCHFGCM